MSTSVIEQNTFLKKRRAIARTGFFCLLCSIFCAIFGAIYETFSHDVYSNFMLYAFFIPLIGGTLPYFSLSFSKRLILPKKPAIYLHNFGLATLTVGCLMKGVLEIYGTENTLLVVYAICGTIFVFLGILHYGITCLAIVIKKHK